MVCRLCRSAIGSLRTLRSSYLCHPLLRRAPAYLDTTQQITAIALSACLVAKDATYNVRDFIEGGSKMALLAGS